MENERFQELVLQELGELKADMKGLCKRVERIESDVSVLKADVQGLNRKLDTISEQTEGLSELRTETNLKLDDISVNMDFWQHKGYQNEKEILY